MSGPQDLRDGLFPNDVYNGMQRRKIAQALGPIKRKYLVRFDSDTGNWCKMGCRPRWKMLIVETEVARSDNAPLKSGLKRSIEPNPVGVSISTNFQRQQEIVKVVCAQNDRDGLGSMFVVSLSVTDWVGSGVTERCQMFRIHVKIEQTHRNVALTCCTLALVPAENLQFLFPEIF